MVGGQIVALGGGGFSEEPDNPLLDDFILSLSPRQPARVCFIPTASADSAGYVARFYRAYSGRCIPSDLTLFDASAFPRWPSNSADLPEFVAAQDIFFVGGGNTANLLALWRTHDLDRLLQDAWRRGAILSGISAGMICWFEGGLTDSFGKLERLDDGLGIIEGTACPHYNGQERRLAYPRLIGEGFKAGYAAEDGVALHFVGIELRDVVSSREGPMAYRVELENGVVVERPLQPRLLGEDFRAP